MTEKLLLSDKDIDLISGVSRSVRLHMEHRYAHIPYMTYSYKTMVAILFAHWLVIDNDGQVMLWEKQPAGRTDPCPSCPEKRFWSRGDKEMYLIMFYKLPPSNYSNIIVPVEIKCGAGTK